jgi:hypothetical protein
MAADYHRLARVLVGVALAAVCTLAAGVPLYAQTTSASVSGTVVDANKGVLPGATVTLTSDTQGTAVTAVTDELGNFFFAYVRPDTYTIKIGLEGFQSTQRPGVLVNANDRLALGTFTLVVGQVTETVTVQATVSDIQTKTGERSFALPAAAIKNIAVNGRSFFPLMGLVPGVVPGAQQDNNVATDPTQVSHFSVNGQRTNSNNMTIDGVANIDTGDNGGNMAQTNLEAVAEFKVLTSSYQAEYGRAVGAQVQVVTKSGTRDFSGSGYWYARRSDWNANTWLNNRSGTQLPKSERNDSGFTIGGPVYLPGLFNAAKDKAFFFFSQEFQRRKDPVNEQRVTVPTALERQGDFSQSLDASGNPYPYIRDYTTGLPCGPTNTSGCFADGGVLGRIPQNRLYLPTLAALNIFPMPNVSGQVGYNYLSQTPSKQPLNQTLIRGDYTLSTNWRAMGRYMQHTNKNELPYGIGGWSIRSNLDTINVVSDTPGRNWLGSVTGILNNTTSLEISVGSGHNSLDHYSLSENMTRTGAGLTELPLLYPSAVQMDLIPRFVFEGGRIANQPFFNTGQAPFTNFNTTYDVVTNLTKVMGGHAAKVGFYYQKSLKDQSAFANHNGEYVFSNSANNPYDSSHPFANAALGVFNTFNQASAFLKPKWRYTNIEWYLQDTWRTRNNLTLDMGVRFYHLTPQWDVSGLASNFLPEEFNSSAAVRLFTPAIVNGQRVGYDPVTGQTVNAAFIGRVVPGSGDRFQGTFQGGNGIDETLSDGSKFAVSPRLGVSWDVTGEQRFVARGGFGIFYDRPQGNTVFDLITNPPGMQTTTVTWGLASQLVGTAPLYAPVNLNPTQYGWKLPKVYAWNAGVQVQLPYELTWDIAYVGSESRDLLQQRQLNALPYGTTYQASSQDPTRGQPGGPALSPLPGGNALPNDFLRPYQGYGTIRMWEFEAFSDYNALQTSLNRRFSKGLMLGASYTYGQSRGTVSGDYGAARIDGRDREANYGILQNDRPHIFVANFVYQTPSVTSGPLAFLTNDWQISGVYRWMNGNPYQVNFNIPGVGATNLTGSDQNARVGLNGDPGNGWSDDPYRQVNTAAFVPPQPGSIGMETKPFFLYNPPYNNLDLSIAKSFPLGGSRRFEIRLDAFNALNHTQFSTINNTVNFRSITDPTITNLPYDAQGNLVNRNGFGTVSGVRPPRQLQLVTRFTF